MSAVSEQSGEKNGQNQWQGDREKLKRFGWEYIKRRRDLQESDAKYQKMTDMFMSTLYCQVEVGPPLPHRYHSDQHNSSQSSGEMPAAKQTLQKWTNI